MNELKQRLETEINYAVNHNTTHLHTLIKYTVVKMLISIIKIAFISKGQREGTE